MKIVLNNISDIRDFVNICSRYEQDIILKKNKYSVDATSLMGVLSIDTSKGVDVEIITDSISQSEKFYNEILRFGVNNE